MQPALSFADDEFVEGGDVLPAMNQGKRLLLIGFGVRTTKAAAIKLALELIRDMEAAARQEHHFCFPQVDDLQPVGLRVVGTGSPVRMPGYFKPYREELRTIAHADACLASKYCESHNPRWLKLRE
jgi:hypothetical protein